MGADMLDGGTVDSAGNADDDGGEGDSGHVVTAPAEIDGLQRHFDQSVAGVS